MRSRTYLAGSALGALGVANGHRPLVRRGWAALPIWLSGWFDSEVPLGRVALQAGLVAGAAGSGLLRTRTGQVATMVNAAAIAGAVHLYRAARQAGETVEQALADELGRDYRGRIRWAPASGAQDVPLLRRRIPSTARQTWRRYVVGDARSIAYGEGGKRNQLDVWRRADLPLDGRAPVLVQVHGGAWMLGTNHNQALPLLTHLADRGWVCVSIRYRLAPKATWPDLIADVLKAVAWTKQNIATFGGDPDFVAITGGSAGGHLSALAALAAGDHEFQPGFEAADTTVQAAVPLYGVYDWLNRYRTNHDELLPWVEQLIIKQTAADARDVFDRASPLGRIHPDAPPFFIIHGANDAMVKAEQARSFADELRKMSRSPVVYAELPYAQHAFDFVHSPRTMHTVHAIERFLGVVYGDHQLSAAAV